MRQLQKLVVSPYFKRHSKTVDLFNYLQDFHPNYRDDALKPENLSGILYPDEPYVSQRVRDVMSFLLEVAEHYLVLKYLKQNPNKKNEILATQLYYQNIPPYLETELNAMDRELHKTPVSDVSALKLGYELARLKFQMQPISVSYYHWYEQSPYHNVVEQWLALVYAELLGHSAEIFASDSDDSFTSVLPQLVELLEKIDFDKNSLIIRVYTCVYHLAKNPTVQNYDLLKELTLNNKHQLPAVVLHKCLSTLLNNLMRRAFADQALLTSEDYMLWKLMAIDAELDLTQTLSAEIFFNMVVEYIKRGNPLQALNFINQYSHHLTINDIFIVDYTMAMVSFADNDFEKTLQYLNKVEVNKLNALRFQYKQLLIMTMYELGEYNVALHQLDTYRHYIKKAKLKNILNKTYYDFYKIMITLVKTVSKPYNQKSVDNLRKYWKSSNLRPTMMGWVIKKIAELDKKK